MQALTRVTTFVCALDTIFTWSDDLEDEATENAKELAETKLDVKENLLIESLAI